MSEVTGDGKPSAVEIVVEPTPPVATMATVIIVMTMPLMMATSMVPVSGLRDHGSHQHHEGHQTDNARCSLSES